MTTIGKSMFPLQNSIRNITDMKVRFDQLQLQLATGKRASSLSEMGTDRFFDLSMRSRLGRIESFGKAIDTVGLRLDVLASTMSRLDSIESDQRGLVTPGGYGSSGVNLATAPELSKARLDEVLNLLNTAINGRYLLGGTVTDRKPVGELDAILRGADGKDGFATVLQERTLADRGDGHGRLDIATAGDTVTLAEDDSHPFGFKLSTLRSESAAVTLTDPSGDPAELAVQFTAPPAAGDRIHFGLTLPDGTEEVVTLTATDGPVEPGSFAIAAAAGGTTTATQVSLATATGTLTINGQNIAVNNGDDAATVAAAVNAAAFGVTASVGTGADGGKLILSVDDPLTDLDVTSTVAGLGIAANTHPATTALENTAASFATALGDALEVQGKTTLAAASTFAAADNFFNGQGEPVLRVDGTPSFAEATELKVASALDTVFWYQGGTQAIGAADMGRLSISTTGATTTLGEDAPLAADYGFRLTGVDSGLSNATVVQPVGDPDVDNGTAESLSVAFTGAPVDGETITVRFEQPDGTKHEVALVAVGGVAGPGEFSIGANPDETAANFEAALTVGLKAAAAQAEGSARDSVTAQVDDGVRVEYGVQANENGMLELVRTLAAMSTASYPNTDDTAPKRFDAMAERNLGRLNEGHNNESGSLEVISVQLGLAHAAIGNIGERHSAETAQLENMLSDIEGVSMEEVAMEILALKTRLEASYQTTSLLSQMSLVNYLPR